MDRKAISEKSEVSRSEPAERQHRVHRSGGYYGYDEYYTLAEDYRSLTIVTGDSFRLAGQYSIQLQAEYYAESLTTEEFTVIAEEKTVPSGEISLMKSAACIRFLLKARAVSIPGNQRFSR